jgi:hypothetical protein
VKTPAAAALSSEQTMARSFLPSFLRPQAIPVAKNPSGAVIPPLITCIASTPDVYIRIILLFASTI